MSSLHHYWSMVTDSWQPMPASQYRILHQAVTHTLSLLFGMITNVLNECLVLCWSYRRLLSRDLFHLHCLFRMALLATFKQSINQKM